MDKSTAVQLAHQILSCDQPELLAAIVAQFSSDVNPEEQCQEDQVQKKQTPVVQQRQNAAPHLDAIFAPLLQDYQLIMLRNVLASLIPILHFAPRPERILFSTGLEVLFRQAPRLASELHPMVQEALRARGGNRMEEFARFINQ